MTKAHVAKSTDEIDEILALQGAEPGTARNITTEEQAIAEAILDAEDGYIVTTDEGGDPVWYLSDAETPDLADCTMHTCWPAGQTWPRIGPDQPTDAAEMAVVQAADDRPHRHEDVPDPDAAADLAVSELLDDPAGWPRYVPAGHDPAAWVVQFRDVYADEWQSGVCADCGRKDVLQLVEHHENGMQWVCASCADMYGE